MKNSWVVGSVVTGHVAAAALLLAQGCQTVQSGSRTALGTKQPTESPTAVQPARALPPANPSAGGRVIRSASEVGKPGTFTEFVVPRTPGTPGGHPAVTPPRPTPHPVPAVPATASTYTVAKGDTLGGIAQKHGVKTRDLLRANNLADASKLKVGQKLNVPAGSTTPSATGSTSTTVKAPTGGTTHKVATGESVSVIAQKYGVRTADILAANDLKSSSMIRVGQTLAIPAAKAAAAKPAKPEAADPKKTPPTPTTPAGVTSPKPPAPTTPTSVTPPAPTTPTTPTIPASVTPPKPPAPATPTSVTPPAPTTPATPTADSGPRYKNYTVKDNEDVYSVAIKWGIAPTELRQINNLTSSELTPGQVLRVPE